MKQLNKMYIGEEGKAAAEVGKTSEVFRQLAEAQSQNPAPAPYNSQYTQRFSAQDNHDNQQKPRSCCD